MKLLKTIKICRGGGNYRLALTDSFFDVHNAARAAFQVVRAVFVFSTQPEKENKRYTN